MGRGCAFDAPPTRCPTAIACNRLALCRTNLHMRSGSLCTRFGGGGLSATLIIAMVVFGCTDEGQGTDGAEDSTGDGSDGGMMQTLTLDFRAAVNGADFACGAVAGIGSTSENAQLDGLRMFISDLKLLGSDGELVDAPIVANDTWAQARVALLDFEESCGDAGSAGTNTSVEVTVPAGEYTGVEFQLGLPFDLNHSDASSTGAAAPLNNAAMFWNWQGGYKFLRLDMKTGADTSTAWNMHLGSTMCMSDTAVTPPTTECGRPNLPTISLDGYDSTTQTIVFDVGVLLAHRPDQVIYAGVAVTAKKRSTALSFIGWG